MTEPEVQEVDTAEAFRAAADAARKAISAGVKDDVASSDEPGSSPASVAESVVPPETPLVPEVTKEEPVQPVVEQSPVVIDPEAAWNEYKTDEDRKKALAHNKAYATQMAAKAKELEAKLAERTQVETKAPEPVKPEAEPEAEVAEVPYEEWVKKLLDKAETEQQVRVSSLVNEYNQLITGKVAPAHEKLKSIADKVSAAESTVRDNETVLKFLQSKEDANLFESEILKARDSLVSAKLALMEAKGNESEAKLAFRDADQERLAFLGDMRKEAKSAHDAEIKARKDSASTKRLKDQEVKTREEVEAAWQKAKTDVISATEGIDEATKQFLINTADGAMIQAARSNRVIPVDKYADFVKEALNPFQANAEKIRQQAVHKAIEIVAEPTPVKATTDKPNVDAQPTTYDEFRRRARATLRGKAA